MIEGPDERLLGGSATPELILMANDRPHGWMSVDVEVTIEVHVLQHPLDERFVGPRLGRQIEFDAAPARSLLSE